jgi:hypothetical protein
MNPDLDRIADQIPLVTGRVLLELANGLTVSSALTADRQRQGIIAQLAAAVTGRDRQAQLMTLRNLVDGQHALTEWLVEVSSRGAVTNLALAQATAYLREMGRIAADARASGRVLGADLQALSAVVAEVAEVCAERLSELEAWRTEISLHLAAQHSFETTVERWQAGRSYAGLPWPYQVLLLAREVAAGPCGRWEFEHGTAGYGTAEYGVRLADRIVAHLKDHAAPTQGFVLATLLDDSWPRLPLADQRMLIADLLDAGLEQGLALPGRPLAATAALTMELAALPAATMPAQPARVALELARHRHGWLDGSATFAGFVRTAVQEQMEMATLTWRRLEAGE